MGIFITIIAIIAVFVFFNKINKNIDNEEEKARTTPGVAQYIRTNFSEIVDCIDSSHGYKKDFERSDYIRYLNASSDMTVVLQQWSGHLKIAVVKDKTLIKEWDLSPKDMSALLLSEIKNTIGCYSYWESYKDRNPLKADAIF